MYRFVGTDVQIGGKWVKLDGWGGAEEAKRIILESVTRFEEAPEKPNF